MPISAHYGLTEFESGHIDGAMNISSDTLEK